MNIIICYTKITPRHIGRIKYLSNYFDNVFVLELDHKSDSYPWWNKEFKSDQQNVIFQKVAFNAGGISEGSKCDLIKLVSDHTIALALLSSYSDKRLLKLNRFFANRHIKTALMMISTRADHKRFFLKESYKRYLLRKFALYFAAGAASKNYLLKLGVPDENIFLQYNSIDNDFFMSESELTDTLTCLKNKSYFLYVGALRSHKNVLGLIKAHLNYSREGGKWDLVIVGCGEEEDSLKEEALKNRINNVYFTGALQQEVLRSLYHQAACLVLPSFSEPWGLVVNEAMCAGLPILASNRCGCVPELVHPGLNGYIFDPEAMQELSMLLHKIENHPQLDILKQNSKLFIEPFNNQNWALSVYDFLNSISSNRPGPE